MDFTNRGSQAAHATTAHGNPSDTKPSSGGSKKSNSKKSGMAAKWAAGALGLLLLALVVSVILIIGVGGKKAESSFVIDDKLQAVFLQTGQVYFGDIVSLNDEYLVLNNIYYLQSGDTTETNANSDVSLVKLGCELHSPYDQMVINREHVTFWENLNEEGQVAEAVKDFRTKNPEGQNCADQAAAPSTNVQGTSTPATNTTEAEESAN